MRPCFSRLSAIQLLYAKESSAEFYLGYSDETLGIYPYKFGLYANYTLDGNALKVTYTAENKDDKPMYFFLGGHPAFRCPVGDDESFTDYCVEFEKNESIARNENDVVLDNANKVPLRHDLFKNDVFMKNKPNSSWVALASKTHDHKVTLSYDKNGCIAVWSSWFEDGEKTNAAEFVCLEPWSSVPVYESGVTELTEMPDAKKLMPNEKYAFTFTVRIG